jgi:hypothetical protein
LNLGWIYLLNRWMVLDSCRERGAGRWDWAVGADEGNRRTQAPATSYGHLDEGSIQKTAFYSYDEPSVSLCSLEGIGKLSRDEKYYTHTHTHAYPQVLTTTFA